MIPSGGDPVQSLGTSRCYVSVRHHPPGVVPPTMDPAGFLLSSDGDRAVFAVLPQETAFSVRRAEALAVSIRPFTTAPSATAMRGAEMSP